MLVYRRLFRNAPEQAPESPRSAAEHPADGRVFQAWHQVWQGRQNPEPLRENKEHIAPSPNYATYRDQLRAYKGHTFPNHLADPAKRAAYSTKARCPCLLYEGSPWRTHASIRETKQSTMPSQTPGAGTGIQLAQSTELSTLTELNQRRERTLPAHVIITVSATTKSTQNDVSFGHSDIPPTRMLRSNILFRFQGREKELETSLKIRKGPPRSPGLLP